MRRARLIATGWEQSLAHEEIADLAAPTSNQVIVAVEACGVCYRDLIDRAGAFAFLRLPITPGHEAAGRVVAVGPQVTRWKVGDRVATLHRDACGLCEACVAGQTSLCERAAFVLGLLADGGYASHLVCPELALYPIPEDLPAATAAVLHCTFGTAYRGLTSAGVRAGHTVLVTGANGGVGTAAVQVARRLGAEVIAVVRDEKHRAHAESLGAKLVVVDPGSTFHKARGVGAVDVVMDCVGQPTFPAALRTLRLGGRIVAIGNVVPEKVAINLGFVIVKALTIIGSSGATPNDMAGLLALRAQHRSALGDLHMPTTELPLARADEAQRRVKAGSIEGRLVLIP